MIASNTSFWLNCCRPSHIWALVTLAISGPAVTCRTGFGPEKSIKAFCTSASTVVPSGNGSVTMSEPPAVPRRVLSETVELLMELALASTSRIDRSAM